MGSHAEEISDIYLMWALVSFTVALFYGRTFVADCRKGRCTPVTWLAAGICLGWLAMGLNRSYAFLELHMMLNGMSGTWSSLSSDLVTIALSILVFMAGVIHLRVATRPRWGEKGWIAIVLCFCVIALIV